MLWSTIYTYRSLHCCTEKKKAGREGLKLCACQRPKAKLRGQRLDDLDDLIFPTCRKSAKLFDDKNNNKQNFHLCAGKFKPLLIIIFDHLRKQSSDALPPPYETVHKGGHDLLEQPRNFVLSVWELAVTSQSWNPPISTLHRPPQLSSRPILAFQYS